MGESLDQGEGKTMTIQLNNLIRKRDNILWFISIMHELKLCYSCHNKIMLALKKANKDIDELIEKNPVMVNES